jgi:S1-C subfamily serine protease
MPGIVWRGSRIVWTATLGALAAAGAQGAVVTPIPPLLDLQSVADRVHSFTVEVRARAFVSNGSAGANLRVHEAVSVASGVLLGDRLVLTALSAVALRRSDGQLEAPAGIDVAIDEVGTMPARLVAGDLSSDVALLLLPDAADALDGATLATSDPTAGDPMIAIGVVGDSLKVVPVNLEHIEKRGDGNRLYTDRALPPPFSGGPLFDAEGHLAGVSTRSTADTGLAVPASVLRTLLDQLRAGSGI